MQKLKEKMFEDYKLAVLECLYYSNVSNFRNDEVNKIKNKYKLNFTSNYEDFIKQFEIFKLEDLENILWILNIEAENEWTNANRCEANALVLWEYYKNLWKHLK